jgi:hypothetical protein
LPLPLPVLRARLRLAPPALAVQRVLAQRVLLVLLPELAEPERVPQGLPRLHTRLIGVRAHLWRPRSM